MKVYPISISCRSSMFASEGTSVTRVLSCDEYISRRGLKHLHISRRELKDVEDESILVQSSMEFHGVSVGSEL